MDKSITYIPQPFAAQLADYEKYLYQEERSHNTIQKYIRDLKALFLSLNGQELTKERLLYFKNSLLDTHMPSSVNSMLAAVNGFLDWAGMPQLKVKPLKIQRSIYAPVERELSKDEYLRLVDTAMHLKNQRLALVLQTICSTGIRISELQFITVESLKYGRTTVACKGKNRTIFLPKRLCRMLSRYCKDYELKSGSIFRTRTGIPLDRSNVWKEMKSLCKHANVSPKKVFPHNLRHLFARTYYQLEKDISRLADLMGHSNISTTRIYTMESGITHASQLEQLNLIPVHT